MSVSEANATTVDDAEVERFSRIASEWWDVNGKFKPLHKINPVRLEFIRDQACAHFGRAVTPFALEGLKLIDIGCGGGLLSEPLTKLGTKVTGIDASEKNIKVAALHAEQSKLAIDYRCASPESLTNETFDIVLALEIIEHVADVPLFMKSVCSLVKPGGLLVMSTINRTFKSYAMAIVGAEYILRWLPRGTHTWDKFVKPSELAAEIRGNGLSLKTQRGMVYNPLRDSWSLSERDLDVNYLVVAEQ